LRERRGEIEQAALARARAVSDPGEIRDPEYGLGLAEAVGEAIDYAIASIEAGGREPPPIPASLLTQARAAARNGVPLDTVLRRYSAGYTLLGDYVIGATQAGSILSGPKLQDVLRITTSTFDRLLEAISREHTKQTEEPARTAGQRRLRLVEMLLDGEPVDPTELSYDLGAWHLAAIAHGPGAAEALRALGTVLDRSVLLIHPGDGAVWAWFGGSRKVSPDHVLRALERWGTGDASLALGEPGQGVGGWRCSHWQGKAAMTVLQRRSKPYVRYADVAVLAASLRDNILADALNTIYLAPLDEERDGGEVLRRTLRAYFAAGRNITSAASHLGVTRQTVSGRLRTFETRVGRLLDDCALDAELAIRLRDLTAC
jgi:hypothetical protein